MEIKSVGDGKSSSEEEIFDESHPKVRALRDTDIASELSLQEEIKPQLHTSRISAGSEEVRSQERKSEIIQEQNKQEGGLMKDEGLLDYLKRKAHEWIDEMSLEELSKLPASIFFVETPSPSAPAASERQKGKIGRPRKEALAQGESIKDIILKAISGVKFRSPEYVEIRNRLCEQYKIDPRKFGAVARRSYE